MPSNSLAIQFSELLTQFLREQPELNTIYVGFSGGVDSTALLLLLHQHLPSSISLRAIHVNHGISPNALNWQQHCQTICHELSIPLHIHQLDLKSNDANLEQTARTGRLTIYQGYQAPGVVFALGHHQDDQAETFLMRLMRGAGLSGLGSIKQRASVSGLLLWRPLLAFRKQQLSSLLEQHKFVWVEDESNQDSHYLRNFIRQRVMPLLESRQPQIASRICQTSAHLEEAEQVLNQYLDTELTSLVQNEALTLSRIRDFDLAKQALLIRRWLQLLEIEWLPDKVHLQQVLTYINDGLDYAEVAFKGVKLVIDREWLYFSKQWHVEPYLLPLQIGDNPLPFGLGQLLVEQGCDVLALDSKWLTHLQVASRPASVALQPKGRQHRRSFKKLLHEYQVPRHLRSVIPVIMIEDEVALLPGYFVNQKFAAVDDNGLQVHWLNSNHKAE